MKQFEYKTIKKIPDSIGHTWKDDYDYLKYDLNELEVLNMFGKDGWEMCGCIGETFYLKREIDIE